MEKSLTNKKIFTSLIWKSMECGGVQGVTFIVSIVLARLLTPKEFGLIALVTIFITLANVFGQRGFNTALIQKKNADELDFSTLLYFSIAVASIFYIIIYFFSPCIANFYGQPILKSVLRVLAIILFFYSINSIQIAIASRKMEFKKIFLSSIGAIFISGIIGIYMAYRGFGIWSLVVQQILNQFLIVVIMFFTIKWRPRLRFSISRFKPLYSYGNKVLIASLIDSFYLNLRSLTIGKFFNTEMVGYFNRGKQFPTVIVSNIDGSIQSVMLPTYSANQDNRERVKSMVRRSIVTSSFLIFPFMALLLVMSESIVKVVLTDKWLPCVPFLQIYCLVYALRPIQTANLQAIKGIGKSGTFLKLELINKTIGILTLIITLRYGVLAITWGVLISGIIAMFLFAYPNIKLLGYTIKEQIIDVGESFLISLIMAAFISVFYLLNISPELLILIQVSIGVCIYFLLAKIFRVEAFDYLVKMVKGFNKK